MTPLINIDMLKFFGLTQKICWVSGVIDTADHKIGDFTVEYLSVFELILKKALTRGLGAQMVFSSCKSI
jgi:hypothetical protein